MPLSDKRWPVSKQALFDSVWTTDFPRLPSENKDFRPSPKGLDKLLRYKVTPASWWPLSPTNPGFHSLYVYYLGIKATGQRNTLRDILKLLTIINKRWLKYLSARPSDASHEGDFFRHHLKTVSSQAYNLTFSAGIQYIPFVHLHQLLGRAPFTINSVIEDIDLWVSDNIDGVPKKLDHDQISETFDRVFTEWGPQKTDCLSFREYCNDYLRWGTSGGAPATTLLGKKHRTKWAYAYDKANASGRLRDDYDIYAHSTTLNKVAQVALKEESAKTREVLTTPMPSYLRQSYLLWRNGTPKLPSPVCSQNFLLEFEMSNINWYGCVDGERFDHSVPADIVYDFIRRLGKVDAECAAIAEEEITSIKELVVKWQDRSWKYKGGLLSGWRITSLLGSAISLAAADFILKRHPTGAFRTGVMGDDLVIYSGVSHISTDDLVDGYNSFGLRSNKQKTVSGPIGEFLRKTRSKGGSFGFPALGVKSICYANPWVSTYTYERELEVCNSWLTFASRLLPLCTVNSKLRRFYLSKTNDQLRSAFQPINWYPWLLTPTSAGGGGCIEGSNHPSKWVNLKYLYTNISTSAENWLPTRLGILKRTLVQAGQPIIEPYDHQETLRIEREMSANQNISVTPQIKDNVSMSRLVDTILHDPVLNRQYINNHLTMPLPRYARTSSRSALVSFLLQPPSNESGITSIIHTKESQTGVNIAAKTFVKYYNLRKHKIAKNIKPAITLYIQNR